MLTQISILLVQIFIMILLMVSGYIVYKLGMLTNSAIQELSNLLAKFVAPFIMICSFQRHFDPALGKTLAIVTLTGLITFLFGIVASAVLYGPEKYKNFANRRMCATYSNNGFMALPLLSAMFGSIGVFYGTAHIVVSTVLTWVYSVPQLEGKHAGTRPDMRKILLNPGTVSLILGLLLFISPWKLPAPVFDAMNYIGALNTPLAMIILGCFLAQTNLGSCFRDLDLLKISIVRLIAIPAAVVLLLLAVPIDETARISLLIGSSAPVAISVATFAQIYESDYLYCTRAVALSTVLSIFTMPLMIALYSALRQFF